MGLNAVRAGLEPVFELRRRAGRAARRLREKTTPALPDEAGLLRAFGGAHGRIEEALADLSARGTALLPADLGPAGVRSFYADRPEWRERLLAAAGRVIEHRFDLLGLEDRPLGPRLPWHRDPVSGHAWDPRRASDDLMAMVAREFGSGRDVKRPWEQARFQHAPLLAQAFWLTRDRRYYDEFRAEVVDFTAENPIGRGVNWGCTMDAALRAVSLTVAATLFRDALREDRPFASLLWRSLLGHGRFIASHLETGEPRGNHYLSDLAGLLVVADALRGLGEAEAWQAEAAPALAAHAARQTLADGADFEASIPYHRLTSEMLHAAVLVLERRGRDASGLRAHLRRRADYTAHYTKPDGKAPQIGDNDDGRFLILGDHRADRRDHRGFLACAGLLFGDPALLQLAGERIEEALWMHGPACLEALAPRAAASQARVTSALFPQAGAAILRGGGLWVHFEAGPVGQGGHGGHAHNDTLSFEAHAEGEDLIVDPGTGQYTADVAARDRFRATAAHNTVRVDGAEINPIPSNPFHLPGIDRPEMLRAVFRRRFDLVEAEHHGYERLADPVTHRRLLFLSRSARRLVIEDRLEAKGMHRVEWFFHLAPRVNAEVDGATLRGRAGSVRFVLAADDLPEGAAFALVEDRFSPGYGRVEPSRTLVVTWEGRLPVSARFHLALQEDLS
jgi:hypothetical protein